MWNRLFRYLTTNVHETSGQTPFRMMEPPSHEDVYQAFRLILGREPGNERAVEAHLLARSVAELRIALINSEEFQGKYRSLHPDSNLNPYWSVDRETLIFIHLKKTGGNSLRGMLQKLFAADRICPMRENNLHTYSVAELGQFDLFAGHFDLHSVNYIPRKIVKVISLFREPTSRLISFYRFARAHPPRDEFAENPTVRLANDLTAEEFFERPEMRSMTEIYNHYLMALGLSCSWFENNAAYPTPEVLSRALEVAKTRIRNMTAIGITEHFADSVDYICHACKLQSEKSVDAAHVTDNLSVNDARFRRVEPVDMTPRLAAALEDLTAYDTEIYRFAVNEFWRRFNEFKGS
jgi:Sulfotransferase family